MRIVMGIKSFDVIAQYNNDTRNIYSIRGGLMKKFICMLLVALLPNISIMMPVNAAGADDASDGAVIVKSEKKSVFKGLLYSMWGKLRAISPRTATRDTRSVATAGVRGAETTTSIISPYWKDDNTEDPEYLRELTEFTKAQQLAENGDLPAAITALSNFIESHSDSDFKANAQFALGISYGGLGKNAESINAFQDFVDDNPKHPLVGDAKQVISELR